MVCSTPAAVSALSSVSADSGVKDASFSAPPTYTAAWIWSASRCGLPGSSVASPPPWNDIAAATRSGTRPATTSEVRPPMQ